MSKRGYDISLIPNDSEKHSPSLRKLRQHYFHDQTPKNDLLKCNDCHKHDGLFQCCHCNQRLCIRCCNKHYKKVTNELEYLNGLTDRLLTKIFHIKTDLEKEKNSTIEQCQQWRIESINKINQTHTLIIQTIQDEYEILNKEYESLVQKKMSEINAELLKIKKGNLGSIISSPRSTRRDSKTSIDLIREHIETFTKQIDDKRKCSFQVNFPTFDIDDNLRVESALGEHRRSTSIISNDENTESKETSKTSSPELEVTSDHYDSNYGTGSSSSEESAPVSRRHTHTFSRTTPLTESIENDALRRRRRTTALPIRSRSSIMTDRLSSEYPWLYSRTKSTSSSSFIQ